MRITSSILAVSTLCLMSAAQASSCGDKICVPEDFSAPGGADFNMDLLAGDVFLNLGGGSIGGYVLGNLQPIRFHASPFTGASADSVGTSTLSYANIDHYTIGEFLVFGSIATFYLNGQGIGSLVDIDGRKGDWSLSVPLFATWSRTEFDFGQVLFSTAASYAYLDDRNTPQTMAGRSMDYASGDAFLVGQATVTGDTPFPGLSVTLGINGNDPVVSNVPEPTVMWSMLSGLGLLAVAAKRRRSAAVT